MERRTLEWLWTRYSCIIVGLGIGLLLGSVYLMTDFARTLGFILFVGFCGLIGFFFQHNGVEKSWQSIVDRWFRHR